MRSRGTPIVLVVLALLIIGYSTVMSRSVFGRHIYALGGNRTAAKLSGINTRRVDFMLFVNMGVLAALAGIVLPAGQRAVMGHGRAVEIQAAVDLVAMLGRDLFGKGDHFRDMIGRD